MKNELTSTQWLALATALKYVNEVCLYEERGDVVEEYESAAEKVTAVAVDIRSDLKHTAMDALEDFLVEKENDNNDQE